MNNITIASMNQDQVREVVQIHLSSFPNFFLTFLGERFLKLLYSEILKSEEGIGLVACTAQGIVIGFVAGVSEQTLFYSRLIKKRWFAFGIASLGAILQRPTVLLRLIKALRYPSESKQFSAQALLMSIAVSTEYLGRGIGRELVVSFLSEMQNRNVESVSLSTDRDHNQRVNDFYRNLGFQCVRTYITKEGRRMNEYWFNLVEVSLPGRQPENRVSQK